MFLPPGEPDDEVGPEEACLRRRARSCCVDEVAVLEHPCELDDALQLHLAPAAAHLRGPQRRHEVARLAAQLLLGFGDGLQQLWDRRRPGVQALLLERRGLRARSGRASPGSVGAGLGELEQRGGAPPSASPVSACRWSSHCSSLRPTRASSRRAARSRRVASHAISPRAQSQTKKRADEHEPTNAERIGRPTRGPERVADRRRTAARVDEQGRSKGLEPKKFSSDKSEDLPELSAGSSESEDLPDPTGGSYSGSWRGQWPLEGESCTERIFRASRFPERLGNSRSAAVGLRPVYAAFEEGGALCRDPAGIRAPAEQAALAEAVGRALANGRAPGGRGGNRHRQEPRLPPAGARVGAAGRRRDRDEGAPGAVARQGRSGRRPRAGPSARRRARSRAARTTSAGKQLQNFGPMLLRIARRRGGVRGSRAVAAGDDDRRSCRARRSSLRRRSGPSSPSAPTAAPAAAARSSRPASPRRRGNAPARLSS